MVKKHHVRPVFVVTAIFVLIKFVLFSFLVNTNAQTETYSATTFTSESSWVSNSLGELSISDPITDGATLSGFSRFSVDVEENITKVKLYFMKSGWMAFGPALTMPLNKCDDIHWAAGGVEINKYLSNGSYYLYAIGSSVTTTSTIQVQSTPLSIMISNSPLTTDYTSTSYTPESGSGCGRYYATTITEPVPVTSSTSASTSLTTGTTSSTTTGTTSSTGTTASSDSSNYTEPSTSNTTMTTTSTTTNTEATKSTNPSTRTAATKPSGQDGSSATSPDASKTTGTAAETPDNTKSTAEPVKLPSNFAKNREEIRATKVIAEAKKETIKIETIKNMALNTASTPSEDANVPADTTTDESTAVVIKGKAVPNSTVYLYIFSDPIIVSVTADADGNWVYILDKPLNQGKHEAYVVLEDPETKEVVRTEASSFFIGKAEARSDLLSPDNKKSLILEDPFTATLKSYITYLALTVALATAVLIEIYLRRRKTRVQSGDIQGA